MLLIFQYLLILGVGVGCLRSLSLPFLLFPHLLSYNVAHSRYIILSEDSSFVSEANSITWFSSSVTVSTILQYTDPFFLTTIKGTDSGTLHLLLLLFSLFSSQTALTTLSSLFPQTTSLESKNLSYSLFHTFIFSTNIYWEYITIHWQALN